MKKKVLFIVLVLAVLLSLEAGISVIYSKTTDKATQELQSTINNLDNEATLANDSKSDVFIKNIVIEGGKGETVILFTVINDSNGIRAMLYPPPNTVDDGYVVVKLIDNDSISVQWNK
jgi:hypothetical protein